MQFSFQCKVFAIVLLLAIGCQQTPVDPPIKTATPSVATQSGGLGTYKVQFETSNGNIVIEVHRDWAPVGATRFHELVTSGFYDECRFFRVVPNFMVQFGINGDPVVQSSWRENKMVDDPVKESNKRGTITFATSGPNSRTSQVFISTKDNDFLDGKGFSPFGHVIEGMDLIDSINSEYLERPNQGQIQSAGNEYLKSSFPNLDYIIKATILKD